MSDENGTIKQRIELEDKVTPALDSMLKSIQGATTAMGALLESVERFQNAVSVDGFGAKLGQATDAVRSISDAYESASRNARNLADITGAIQPPSTLSTEVAPNSISSSIQPPNVSSPEVTPNASGAIPNISPSATNISASAVEPQEITFNTEINKIRNNISELISGIGNTFKPLRDTIVNGLGNIGNAIAQRLQPVRAKMASFGAYIGQRFQTMRESVARRLEPMVGTAGRIFLRVRERAEKYLSPIVNIAKMAFSKVGSIVKGGLLRAGAAIRERLNGRGAERGEPSGMGNMLGGFGKFAMIAGTATAALAGFKKMADIASERTTQINSLNYMSDAQRNGLKGDEIQDYGVKYANRIGMSADDFTAQSIKLLKTTDAFGSIGEAMNFNELLQKQLKASGVDAQEANRVTEMYSRGLMKGFDSRELKTIMEEAPALADSLAKAAKVSTPAELLGKAGRGKITAQVAKDAIFGNSEDIEKQFASTPKTMNELFEKLKNSAAQALDPISQKITDIANKPEVQAFVDRLIDGMTWFSGVAGEAFEFVTDAIGAIAPYVEEIVTPIKEILFSVWDIIKGLIDNIAEMFMKDEEFGKSAQSIWGDFRSVLERLKPIVEGFVETIAGGIKILMGVAKNVMTLYENARTGLHNLFSDDELEYQSFDTDVFVEGASQIAGGVKKGIGEAVDLIGDTLTKNLDPIVNMPFVGPTLDMMNSNDDRIQAGITPTKPLHVKQVGKTKIDKESLQLLKDLAQAEVINRVNNIQPAITANFGDVHETADIDAMLERLEQDVVSARGQNLMLQTGMQYAL